MAISTDEMEVSMSDELVFTALLLANTDYGSFKLSHATISTYSND